jgi:membrane protease subunit (stomatin/prohibitin family)
MLVEVIQSLDNTGELIVSRFPEDGEADLKLGAQLIVRQTQTAVFFRSGKALDTFGPGRHTLISGNLPLLGELLNWGVFRGDTPFKAEVIFTNHKVFTNQKWGTKEPVLFRDRELAMVRLRAFGIHSFRVTDAHRFVDTIVGTQGIVTSPQIADFLRNIIIGRLADFLGETLQTIFDLPSSYDEIGTAMKARIRDDFGKYGLSVEDFIISAITPPEEVQKRIDERSSMALFGNLDHYMKYKTAQALQDAAQQPGGTAGAGVGAGLGLGVGLGMLGGLQQALQPGQPAAPSTPQGASAASGPPCEQCRQVNPPGAKFCSGCGGALPSAPTCPKCQSVVAAGAKFCSGCGSALAAAPAACSQCQTPSAPGAKFCASCGHRF